MLGKPRAKSRNAGVATFIPYLLYAHRGSTE